MKSLLYKLAILLFTLITSSPSVGAKIKVGDLYFEIIDEDAKKAAVVSAPSGEYHLDRIIIPETIPVGDDIYTVTNVGGFAWCIFYSISLPETVENIDEYAFYNACVGEPISLTHIKRIGDYAFTSIMLISPISDDSPTVLWGNKLEDIGKCAFYENSVTNLNFPPTIKSIGEEAFKYCRYLKSVNFESTADESLAGQAKIGNSAFHGCSSLKSVNLGNTVSVIGESAFSNGGNTNIEDINFGTHLTEIRGWAFSDQSLLKAVKLPESMKLIGNMAFNGCTSIEDIDLGGTEVIGQYAFSDIRMLKSLKLSPNLTSICACAFEGCTGLEGRLNFPMSLINIGEAAFSGCSMIEEVTFGSKLEYIGSNAFSGINGINSITIPASVTEIGPYAFNRCGTLWYLTIEDSANSLHVALGAFKSTPLSEIYIGRDLTFTDMVLSPFKELSYLLKVDFGDKVTTVGPEMFNGCSRLKWVNLPESISMIEENAFAGCDEIISVYSKNPEPPEINSSPFSLHTYNNACLYVPMGSKGKYKVADFWKCFSNISEYDTGIEETEASDYLNISGIIDIYDLCGRLIFHNMDSSSAMNVLSPGIYIFKGNNKVAKVLIKTN